MRKSNADSNNIYYFYLNYYFYLKPILYILFRYYINKKWRTQENIKEKVILEI